jgi:hypothetical protein
MVKCNICQKKTVLYNGLCEEHTEKAFNKECPICFEKILKKNKVQFECNHKVHWGCLSQLVSADCPLCRTKLKYIPPFLLNHIKNVNNA